MWVFGAAQVMVTGLPSDTTAAQLVDHFSGLYDLTKPDWTYKVCVWGGGKEGRGASPVMRDPACLYVLRPWCGGRR